MGLYVASDGGRLLQVRDVTPGPDLYESEIEQMAWDNLEVFTGEALFQLRRQAALPGGGRPDILALDRSGRVVVIEVKRDVDRGQLSQALEYAGWARSTNLDEVADLYDKGAEAFFADWMEFTQTTAPVTVNRAPILVLVARDVHPRTGDALRFLADNGLPVTVVPVSVYADNTGRRFVEIERESESTTSDGSDGASAGPKGQRSYMYEGHAVRIADLVRTGLLAEGTEIELTAKGTTVRGTITADGNIEIGSNSYSTPSAAGVEACGQPVDGWVRWRVPSLGGITLADVRTQLLTSSAST